MFNIVMGLLAIAAGLSGQFALLGTNSPWALVGVGLALTAYGAYQVKQQKYRVLTISRQKLRAPMLLSL